MSEHRVDGQVAVVTGVTGKVGRGIALTFARAGARVVGTGRRAERGRQFEEAARAEGLDVTFVQGDVSRVGDCERVIQTAVQLHGRLDILVNNAASLTDTPMVASADATEDWWDEILDTNLKGAFFCSRFALAPMLAQGSGTILNISSAMSVIFAPTRMAAYVASKAGLNALTKTMAIEYAADNIRFNSILLGAAEGDNGYRVADARSREALGDSYVPEPYDDRDSGRMTGEQLAETLLYLCQPEARHIVGAEIAVDSGISAGLAAAGTWARPRSSGTPPSSAPTPG